MTGIAHDTLLLALKDKPELLAELLRRLAGVTLTGPLTVADSAIRWTRSLETTPDILLTTKGPASSWVVVEVQNRKDETKSRSWHLATSVLLQRGPMGDVVVVTASRAVARWATEVAQHRGALGTTKGLTPVVLYLGKDALSALLDPRAPELALFAVWARCRGAGPEAKRVAGRALALTKTLPSGLQEAQTRAILGMLSERLLLHLKDISMDINQIKETKASREFRLFLEAREAKLAAKVRAEALARGKAEGLARGKAEGLARGKAEGLARGKAEGKRSALFAILTARGLTPTRSERAQLSSVNAMEALDRCLLVAATCETVAAVLEAAQSPVPRRAARTPGSTKKAGGHRS